MKLSLKLPGLLVVPTIAFTSCKKTTEGATTNTAHATINC